MKRALLFVLLVLAACYDATKLGPCPKYVEYPCADGPDAGK